MENGASALGRQMSKYVCLIGVFWPGTPTKASTAVLALLIFA